MVTSLISILETTFPEARKRCSGYPALRCKAKPQGYGPVDSHHGPVIQTTDDLPDLATSDGSDLVDH